MMAYQHWSCREFITPIELRKGIKSMQFPVQSWSHHHTFQTNITMHLNQTQKKKHSFTILRFWTTNLYHKRHKKLAFGNYSDVTCLLLRTHNPDEMTILQILFSVTQGQFGQFLLTISSGVVIFDYFWPFYPFLILFPSLRQFCSCDYGVFLNFVKFPCLWRFCPWSIGVFFWVYVVAAVSGLVLIV